MCVLTESACARSSMAVGLMHSSCCSATAVAVAAAVAAAAGDEASAEAPGTSTGLARAPRSLSVHCCVGTMEQKESAHASLARSCVGGVMHRLA